MHCCNTYTSPGIPVRRLLIFSALSLGRLSRNIPTASNTFFGLNFDVDNTWCKFNCNFRQINNDMENKKCNPGLFIMIGLVFLGAMVPVSVVKLKSFDNTVSVRGLCEKEINADRVIWPITFKIAGDDLSEVYSQIQNKTDAVKNFLKKGGLEDSEITIAPAKISDKYTQEYGGNDRAYRYVTTCTVTVCSGKVDAVMSLMNAQTSLIDKGIVLSNEWDSNPSFTFEGLNDIKPTMIEEATANAREVALKFANDSGSRLGKIKSATQGVFSIEDRDSNTPNIKKVRVVTNVVYYLR